MKKDTYKPTAADHLKRAQEFQNIIDAGLCTSNTDKLVYERLRDQRIRLAKEATL